MVGKVKPNGGDVVFMISTETEPNTKAAIHS